MAIKPSTSKGTRDFSPNEIAKRNYIKNILQNAFEIFGFNPIETPSFERLETLTDIYGEEGDRLLFKILNSGDKINKADTGALTLRDNQKFIQSISDKALRYDLTVPFARYVAQHQNEISFPFRRYQIQPVWRADRPQHGRFQEFYQCDADIVGDNSLWQEVEVLSLYDRVFKDLNIEGVVLRINNRKILAGIVGVLGAESRLNDFTVALDKLHKIGKEGVFNELTKKDFSYESIKLLQKFIDFRGTFQDQIQNLRSLLSQHEIGLEGLSEIEFVFDKINFDKLSSVKFEFDLTLARGLHYYTGIIVEVVAPKTVKIGSIGGGGRYDDLTSHFGLKDVSGVGISFGFERIYIVMEKLGLFPDTILEQTQVLFANFGGKATEIAYSYITQLRNKNVSSELYPKNVKLKKQLGYANSKGIKKVVLIGSEELENQVFVLKIMDSGEQITYPLKNLITLLS